MGEAMTTIRLLVLALLLGALGTLGCASQPDAHVCSTGIICHAPLQCAAVQAICIVNNCGNGRIDPGEQCDDGTITGLGSCSSTCQLEFCGNGIIDPGEVCDLGSNNGKCLGCSSDCKSNESCGNNIVDPECGEVCDNGPNPQNLCNGCSSNCKSDQECGNDIVDTECGEVCDPPGPNCSPDCRSTLMCGNGIINPGEQCDNGAANADDADCLPNCMLNVCGDGFRDTVGPNHLEACDTGSAVGATSCPYEGSATFTSNACTVCDDNCTAVASSTGPFCGDGVVQTADGETCDNASGNGALNCPYGQATCTLCGSACKTAGAGTGPTCGDGITESADGETCDAGSANGTTTCAYQLASPGSPGTCTICNNTCKGTNGPFPIPFCGDGITQTGDGEECDNGSANGAPNCAYGDPTCTLCTSMCKKVSGTGPFCGDGNPNEDGKTCDQGALNGTFTCPYSATVPSPDTCDICNATCTGSNGPFIIPYCGDGITQTSDGEQCDLGSANGTGKCPYGDANCTLCGSDCKTGASGTGPVCGDGITENPPEACDQGAANGTTTCPYPTGSNSMSSYSCLICNSTCTAKAGPFTGPFCGDFIVESSDGEMCDEGSANGTFVCPYGVLSCAICNLTCSGTNAGTTFSYCGDGVVQTTDGETCDNGSNATTNTGRPGPTNGGTVCNYVGGSTATSNTCTACDSVCESTSPETGPFCGDGILQTTDGETCDNSHADETAGCGDVTNGDTTGCSKCLACQSTTYLANGATCTSNNQCASLNCSGTCM
jgi:cysteine-rich repeat protein